MTLRKHLPIAILILIVCVGLLASGQQAISVNRIENMSFIFIEQTDLNDYRDPDGIFSFQYPNDWTISSQQWSTQMVNKFDSEIIIDSKEQNAKIVLHVWKNISANDIKNLSETSRRNYLSALTEQKENNTECLISNNPCNLSVEQGIEKVSPTSMHYTFFDGENFYQLSFTSFSKTADINGLWTILRTFSTTRTLIESSQGTPKTEIPAVIPEFVNVSPGDSTCTVKDARGVSHTFWDPNGNRYPCKCDGCVSNCVWWADYMRPDISLVVQSSNWGNAGEWLKPAMDDPRFIVSNNPQPGAIAVWKPGVGGAGVYGHVAYVEWVAPNFDTFWVSEMNWDNKGIQRRSVNNHPDIQFILGGVTLFDNKNFHGAWRSFSSNHSTLAVICVRSSTLTAE